MAAASLWSYKVKASRIKHNADGDLYAPGNFTEENGGTGEQQTIDDRSAAAPARIICPNLEMGNTQSAAAEGSGRSAAPSEATTLNARQKVLLQKKALALVLVLDSVLTDLADPDELHPYKSFREFCASAFSSDNIEGAKKTYEEAFSQLCRTSCPELVEAVRYCEKNILGEWQAVWKLSQVEHFVIPYMGPSRIRHCMNAPPPDLLEFPRLYALCRRCADEIGGVTYDDLE